MYFGMSYQENTVINIFIYDVYCIRLIYVTVGEALSSH